MKQQWMGAGGGGDILASLWMNDPMTIALLAPGFVPNYDAQKVWADVAGSEIAGTGYAAGGKLLAAKATPYTAGGRYDLQAANVQWGPGATFNTAFAVVYDNSGAKVLWSMIDFGGTSSVVNGTFTINFSATGVLYTALAP